jgi:hypothetical protein
MQTMIKANDGDLFTVHAGDLSIDEPTITLELDGPAYGASGEFDSLTLSTRCARELARALLQSADLADLNARKLCGTKDFNFIAFNSTANRQPTRRPGPALS